MRFCFVCLTSIFIASTCLGVAQQMPSELAVQKLRAAADEAGSGRIAMAEADARAAIALDPTRAAAWYELGSVLGQAADFSAAETALRRAIELEPKLAKAHYSLALTLVANPQNKLDWAQAIDQCRAALQYQPEYPEALNLLGTGLANSGKTDEAIATLQGAIRLEPSLAEVHLSLALALESKERLSEASEQYRAAIAARSDYPEALSGLGKLLLRQDHAAEAERELDAALRVNPDLTDAHYTLARVLRMLNHSGESVLEFNTAKELIDRQPNGIQASQLSNQALEIAAHGDVAGAIGLLHKAIALKPDYGVPHYNLGLILADSKDNPGAIQELSKAISLMPGRARLWFDLGRVLQRVGDSRGALEAIRWAAYLSPSDAAIAAELASLQRTDRSGETEHLAAPVEQPSVGAAGETALAHLAFAQELLSRADTQGATGELLRALALKPAMVEARKLLAAVDVQLGYSDKAILEYAKVARLFPEDADVHFALGRLLIAQKGAREGAAARSEEGIAQLRVALQLRPNFPEARSALEMAEKTPGGVQQAP